MSSPPASSPRSTAGPPPSPSRSSRAIAGRWRLIGSSAAPTGVPVEALSSSGCASGSRPRTRPRGAPRPGPPDPARTSSRLPARPPPPEMAVVAATERVLATYAAVAPAAGWRVRRVLLDGAEILPISTTLADSRVTAVLAGAYDPPGADERSLLPDLGTIVAAATERRPDLVTVLAGGLAEPGGRIETLFRPDRPGPTLLAPAATVGDGEPLRELLDALRGGDSDGRRTLATATATLADVLRRRVEVVGDRADGRRAGRRRVGRGPALDRADRGLAGSRAAAAAVHRDESRRRHGLARDPAGPAPCRGTGFASFAGSVGRRGRRGRDAATGGRQGGRRAAARRDAGIGALRRPGPLVAAGGAWASLPGPPLHSRSSTSCGARGSGPSAGTMPGCWGRWARSQTPTSGSGHGRPPRRARRSARQRRHAGRDAGGPGGRPSRVRGGDGQADAAELELVPGGLELVDLPPGRARDRRDALPGGRGPRRPRPPCRGRGDRRPRRDCSWTCATCRSACPTGPNGGGSCWRRGRPRCGRATRRDDARLAGRDPRAPLRRGWARDEVPLPPGDRPLVEPGSPVRGRRSLLEHLRDRRIDEVEVRDGADADRPAAGTRWAPVPGRRRSGDHAAEGELLAPLPGRQGTVAARDRRPPRHRCLPGRRRGGGRSARRRDPMSGPPDLRLRGRLRRRSLGARPSGAGDRPVRRAAARWASTSGVPAASSWSGRGSMPRR